MSEKKPEVGTIAWHDLTVDDASAVKDFYSAVVGWESKEHDCGGYFDFNMITPGKGEIVAGICHAIGVNANLPAQWLIYIIVADVADSARTCEELGGTVIDGPRAVGNGQFCVIRDPAGAVAALYSTGDGE